MAFSLIGDNAKGGTAGGGEVARGEVVRGEVIRGERHLLCISISQTKVISPLVRLEVTSLTSALVHTY